jgi:CDP-glucose 4,6-dehydratase
VPLREDDRLGGKDPYSASKAGCELLVASHRTTYFEPAGTPLATVRGGNVIGGGDFSEDRLIPDIVRATLAGETLVLRHPGGDAALAARARLPVGLSCVPAGAGRDARCAA